MAKLVDKGLGRRTFLRTSSVGAGAAALSGIVTGEALATEHWDDAADVVILGYGGAGACAAIEARDSDAVTSIACLSGLATQPYILWSWRAFRG